MKVESTQNRRPEDDPQQEPDDLGKQRDKRRKDKDSAPQLRVPDPPDPDNLPVEYPGPREIEWP